MRRVEMFALCLSLLAVTAACGSDKSPGADADAESGSAASGSGSEVTSAESSAEVGSTGESGETTDGPATEPARGLDIDKVTTNQGTLVDIGLDGEWVDGSNRRTVIVGSRDTLVQVHHSVDAGWTPRELEARLHLFDSAGEPVTTLTQRKVIEGNSTELDLQSAFTFGLVTDNGETETGLQFQVEVVEVGEPPTGLEVGIWQTPQAGPNFVGFEADPMEMRVVFVPITYNGSTPTLSDNDKRVLEDHIVEHNPLQSIDATYHEPVAYDETITDLGQLLSTMSDLRAAEDNQFTNIYYAALVRVNYPGGVAGIAQVASAAISSERISANVWYDTGNSDTVVHEIGHNQGLSHVACPGGNSAGNDDSYPDPEGRIMSYGFGIKTFELHPQSEHDYMSYCSPSWVSPWTWSKTFFRILALTAWDYDLVVPPPGATTLLKGVLLPSGKTKWWTGPGLIEPELSSANHLLRFEIGGETIEQLGSVYELSEGGGLWIETALPAPLEQIGAMSYVGPEGAQEVRLDDGPKFGR